MTQHGKRTEKSREGVDRMKLYSIDEAIKMVKERATAKFDETIEVAMNLGVDPRHSDQMVRGVVNLPNGSGRSVRVGVFARGAKADEARAAGADVVGAEDLVEQVQAGNIDFDRCIATPDLMPLVGRLGKVLGPRGMMPNPKVGTVTMDVTTAVRGAKGGSVEFRVEKAGTRPSRPWRPLTAVASMGEVPTFRIGHPRGPSAFQPADQRHEVRGRNAAVEVKMSACTLSNNHEHRPPRPHRPWRRARTPQPGSVGQIDDAAHHLIEVTADRRRGSSPPRWSRRTWRWPAP